MIIYMYDIYVTYEYVHAFARLCVENIESVPEGRDLSYVHLCSFLANLLSLSSLRMDEICCFR